jgi:hypothetical protein
MKDYLKDRYLEVRQEAFESEKLDRIRQNTGVYTFEMICALRDMAGLEMKSVTFGHSSVARLESSCKFHAWTLNFNPKFFPVGFF